MQGLTHAVLPVERIDITMSTKRNFLMRRKGMRAGARMRSLACSTHLLLPTPIGRRM
jgi:hypothetical protein